MIELAQWLSSTNEAYIHTILKRNVQYFSFNYFQNGALVKKVTSQNCLEMNVWYGRERVKEEFFAI